MTPHCDLDLEDRNQTFSHETLGYDDAPSYRVWLHAVEKLSSGKGVTHTDSQTDGQPDFRIPLLTAVWGRGGVYKQGTFDSAGLPPGVLYF